MLTPISCYGCGKHLCDVEGKFKITLENVIRHHTGLEILITCAECGEKASEYLKILTSAARERTLDGPFNQILKENGMI